MDHDAPALRLIERPFIRESRSGVGPFHIHDLIRSAIRNADDGSDDRWSRQNGAARGPAASAGARILLYGPCSSKGSRSRAPSIPPVFRNIRSSASDSWSFRLSGPNRACSVQMHFPLFV